MGYVEAVTSPGLGPCSAAVWPVVELLWGPRRRSSLGLLQTVFISFRLQFPSELLNSQRRTFPSLSGVTGSNHKTPSPASSPPSHRCCFSVLLFPASRIQTPARALARVRPSVRHLLPPVSPAHACLATRSPPLGDFPSSPLT